MRLVVDANILVSEALRARGRALLGHPELDLFVATEAADEAAHELHRRVALIAERQQFDMRSLEALLTDALLAVQSAVTVVPPAVYHRYRDQARERMSRDPDDAPTVALALLLDCGIWTADLDFFGCGLAVWVTDTLQAHLRRGLPASAGF